MAEIRPYKNRVVVERLPEREVSKGGIFIPDQAQEKPRFGNVLSVGEGVTGVTPGDCVCFGKFAGVEIKDAEEGLDVLLLKADDIHGFKI